MSVKKYSVAEIVKDMPLAEVRPLLPFVPSSNNASCSKGERSERASKYLSTIPGAVQGNNGSRTTFIAAKKLLTVCGLSVEEAYKLMLSEYNNRCSPPWSDAELWHKVESAAHSGRRY
jgi:hypothetical protein